MRVAVLSDVHANQPALEAVYEDFVGQVDEVWFLGDLFGYGPYPTQVFTKMIETIQPFPWLAGNNDLAIAGSSECINVMNNSARQVRDKHAASIPKDMINKTVEYPTQSIFSPRAFEYEIYLAHGFPAENDIKAANDYDSHYAPRREEKNGRDIIVLRNQVNQDSKIWIVGHSHMQKAWILEGNSNTWTLGVDAFGQQLDGSVRMHIPDTLGSQILAEYDVDFGETDPDLLVILNPGSVGLPRDGLCMPQRGVYLAKYMLLELHGTKLSAEFRSVSYNAESLIEQLRAGSYPEGLFRCKCIGEPREVVNESAAF